MKPSETAMPKKKTIYCNNRSVGLLLPDAKSGALIEPGREEHRRVFFDEHLEECRQCRDEIIDHANQLALSEAADETCVEIEGVMELLGETARHLRDFARDRDIPFEEVVLGILRGRPYVTTSSKPIRTVSSVASTEA
jgi:hypothetical protein